MRELITQEVIIAEARMLYCHYSIKTILVEGVIDKAVIEGCFNTMKIHVKRVCGWENVVKLIIETNKQRLSFVAGVIDRDYHILLDDGVVNTDNILFTDENDIEMMLIHSRAFDDFLVLCCNEEKVRRVGDVREKILCNISPIGALRYLSRKMNYNLWFHGLELKDFVDRNTLAVDIDGMVNKVHGRTISHNRDVTFSKTDLTDGLKEVMTKQDGINLCNGHDALQILSLAMIKVLSSNNAGDFSERGISERLMMAYINGHFQITTLYASLHEWISGIA